MPRKRPKIFFIRNDEDEKESHLDALGHHLFVILLHIVFLFSVLMFASLVFVFIYAETFVIVVFALLVLVTSPMTIYVLKQFSELGLKKFFSSLMFLGKDRTIQKIFLFVLNTFLFFRIGLQTMIPLLALLGLYLLFSIFFLVFPAKLNLTLNRQLRKSTVYDVSNCKHFNYNHSKEMLTITKSGLTTIRQIACLFQRLLLSNWGLKKKAAMAFFLGPFFVNCMLSLNYLVSFNPVVETYVFSFNYETVGSPRLRSGTTQRSTLLQLKNNKYSAYPGIRVFWDYHKVYTASKISYTFKTGILGIRVMTDYYLV